MGLLEKYKEELNGKEVFEVTRKENCMEILDECKSLYDIIFFDIDMPYTQWYGGYQDKLYLR